LLRVFKNFANFLKKARGGGGCMFMFFILDRFWYLFICKILAEKTLVGMHDPHTVLCHRVSDPNLHGYAFLSYSIRIRIKEGKNDPQKKKEVKNFHILKKCWMFSFGG
jgi:hypothetical protein